MKKNNIICTYGIGICQLGSLSWLWTEVDWLKLFSRLVRYKETVLMLSSWMLYGRVCVKITSNSRRIADQNNYWAVAAMEGMLTAKSDLVLPCSDGDCSERPAGGWHCSTAGTGSATAATAATLPVLQIPTPFNVKLDCTLVPRRLANTDVLK